MLILILSHLAFAGAMDLNGNFFGTKRVVLPSQGSVQLGVGHPLVRNVDHRHENSQIGKPHLASIASESVHWITPQSINQRHCSPIQLGEWCEAYSHFRNRLYLQTLATLLPETKPKIR